MVRSRPTRRRRWDLARLSGPGAGAGIDDVGAAGPSLTRRERLPVDEIEIDRFLVIDGATDTDGGGIVASTIGIGPCAQPALRS